MKPFALIIASVALVASVIAVPASGNLKDVHTVDVVTRDVKQSIMDRGVFNE